MGEQQSGPQTIRAYWRTVSVSVFSRSSSQHLPALNDSEEYQGTKEPDATSHIATTLELSCAQALLMTHPARLCTLQPWLHCLGDKHRLLGKRYRNAQTLPISSVYWNSDCLVQRTALPQLPTEFPHESRLHFIVIFSYLNLRAEMLKLLFTQV